ncbi:MAG TPA: PEP-CTERM sorting domain-containing protein [Burkholderiaceae bacterium]
MSNIRQLASAFALTLLSVAAHAATTTYTSSASFLAQVAPGAYTENFNAAVDPGGLFSSGGFSYAISSPGELYFSGDFVGTNQIDSALTVSFTGGNVFAVGANFFATNISDEFQAVSLTLTLSDGTVTSFTPTSLSDSYRGFVSNLAITSLTISAPGQSLYAGLDNLTVGAVSPVPEPASWALMGLGVAGLLATRRRTA